MSDQEIIAGLINRNERITKLFFFIKCRPLFKNIINHVFSYEVDYDEFVNELYLYLMENNAHRLKQFQGRSSIYQWLKVTAIRYFIAKRNSMIDMEPKDTLINSIEQSGSDDDEKKVNAKMDIEQLFSLMQNKRYVYVIRRLILEEAEPQIVAQELNTNVDNLYNIKKRAISALAELAIKEVEKYEK